LSHSLEPGALMQTYYDAIAVPDADDVAGMCAALGSAASDPVCDVPALPSDAGCLGSDTSCRSQRPAEDPGEDGCSCHVGAPARPSRLGWGAAFAFIAFGCRRRRR
jgi:MYXO-CTERM domain-containing protein